MLFLHVQPTWEVRMKPETVKLMLILLANVTVSIPIFIVGGSFIFAGNDWSYFGIGSMFYAVLSCILLFFTLATPTREVLTVDRVAICCMAVSSFFAFVVFRILAYSLFLALGAALVCGIKWITHTYVFNLRYRLQ